MLCSPTCVLLQRLCTVVWGCLLDHRLSVRNAVPVVENHVGECQVGEDPGGGCRLNLYEDAPRTRIILNREASYPCAAS